jgi:hypothetical protein
MQKISHFGSLIYEFAKQQDLSIRELAEKVKGTTPSTFSKIRGGNYAKLTDDRLNAILDALAPNDHNQRALLVCAYLWDLCPTNFHTSVEISPRLPVKFCAKDKNGKTEIRINDLLPELLSDIGKAAANNPQFFKHVKSLADLAKSVSG